MIGLRKYQRQKSSIEIETTRDVENGPASKQVGILSLDPASWWPITDQLPPYRTRSQNAPSKVRQVQPAAARGRLVAEVAEEVFDLGEEAFGFRVGGAAAAFLFEFVQKLFLALRQVDRGFDDELSEHVASGAAIEFGHTLTA